MISQPYDADSIAKYFDAFGELEWSRFEGSPVQEIKLALHVHYLEHFVPRGSRVLEVGAGPGRFTRELARIGCDIVVTDISDVQIQLNRKRAMDEGYADAVIEWRRADVTGLEGFRDDSFDAVLAYGGPLSYAMDRRAQAVAECVRVLRPGGVFLASVMSLWGTIHAGLPAVLKVATDINRRIVSAGDLTDVVLPGNRQSMHLFRSGELVNLLENAGCDLLAVSASNSLATGWEEDLATFRDDRAKWAELLELEVESSASPGCVDLGTHIIAVARKRA